MRLFACLLVLLPLAAQVPVGGQVSAPEFRTQIGTDPLTQVRLVRTGCWESAGLSAASPPLRTATRRLGQATVEVWGLTYQETPRQEVFSLYQKDLKKSLARAFQQPPASHASLELADLMLSDPSHPERLDLTRVQSMQERFNRAAGAMRR